MTTATGEIEGLTAAAARSAIGEEGGSIIIGSMAGLGCGCGLVDLVWKFSVEF